MQTYHDSSARADAFNRFDKFGVVGGIDISFGIYNFDFHGYLLFFLPYTDKIRGGRGKAPGSPVFGLWGQLLWTVADLIFMP